MDSRWNDGDAAEHVAAGGVRGLAPDLALRNYTSRLIGSDPDLVLHGGGNTSVKIGTKTDERVLHVKGSGWDLGEIDAPGLPALRVDPLLADRGGARMSNDEMVAFLRNHLVVSGSPNPSIETLLHAFLPHRFVDHCHATGVLALADQDDMATEVQRIFDGRLAFVPYVMPGYDLAVEADRVFQDNPGVEGLWLEKHGIFAFGHTAQGSYERTIRSVSRAEEELVSRGAPVSGPQASDRAAPEALAELLRAALLDHGGLGDHPASDFRSTPAIRAFLAQPHLSDLAGQGTATPDHVIRLPISERNLFDMEYWSLEQAKLSKA